MLYNKGGNVMNKTKKWLIFAASLVILGSLIFTAVMTAFNWNFEKLDTTKYQTKTYTLTETFKEIKINTNTADIVLTKSSDQNCKIICQEEVNASHSVLSKDNLLSIELANNRKWYENVGITTRTPKITIYLPEREYTSLVIKTSTGDVELPPNFKCKDVHISTTTGNITTNNITSENIKLSVSTGHITAQNITCQNITANVNTGKTMLSNISCDYLLSCGNTGDIKLQNFIAKEKITIERDTGDINFDNSDSSELIITTNTGDITGNLLSEKIFRTETTTGDINVPNTVNGGICRITTDTGDIKIDIVK